MFEGFNPSRLAGEPAPAGGRAGCDVGLDDLTVELVRDEREFLVVAGGGPGRVEVREGTVGLALVVCERLVLVLGAASCLTGDFVGDC